MTKTDELLNALNNKLGNYLKSIGAFRIERLNSDVKLIDNYKAETYHTCAACGKPNILHIFVVQNAQGQLFDIGCDCIENLANVKIENFYKNIQDKKLTITKNRLIIDTLSGFLSAVDNTSVPIFVSEQGEKKMRIMFERLCKGYEPDEDQRKLFIYYMKKAVATQNKSET